MSSLVLPTRTAETAAAPLTIAIDPEPYRLYRESIACNPPETVALLGGRLDQPTHITDFYFLPPQQRGGRLNHGYAHIELDHAAMNYVVDRVLGPNGKYILGIWHSHPGGYTRPSEPDLRLCAAILSNDDSPGRRWPFFLAPITTFDADGRDRVTAWVLRKGAAAFEPAVFVPPAPTTVPLPAAPTEPNLPDTAVVPTTGETPAPAEAPDEAGSDPLAASAARLGRLLARPDGLVGLPRYRAGIHLQTALCIAESGAAAELQP